MSTFRPVECKCGVCGTKFQVNAIMSTNCFGSPDLDMRPPEMERSTMHFWVRTCPECGYVNSDIEKRAKKHRDYIKSEAYRECQGNRFTDDLSKHFYQFALILIQEKKLEDAFFAFLHAAWAADDSRDTEGARICRNKAIELYDQFKKTNSEDTFVIRADILRRAGRFDEVVNQYSGFKSDKPLLNKVIQFQIERASVGDDTVYTVEECDSIFMNLYDGPFEQVRDGKKTVEVRCNDEKRKNIKVGDTIVFTRSTNPSEKVYTKVINLQAFPTFKELYSSFPLEVFGDPTSKQVLIQQINEIYSKEKQEKYGALAITIKRRNDEMLGLFGK